MATEINLVFLLKILKSAWWKMLIFAVIIALLVGACTELLIPKQYSASVDFYIVNMSITSEYTTGSLLSAAEYLANDYIEIINGDKMLEVINSELKSEGKEQYTNKQLRSMISAKTSDDTSIFTVSVTANDPNTVYAISKAICSKAPEVIKEITRPYYVANLYVFQGVGADGVKSADDFTLISENDLECVDVVRAPVKPTESISPHPVRNGVIGALLMAILVYALCFIYKMMDTVLHGEESLKALVNKPIIGNIPSWRVSSTKANKN